MTTVVITLMRRFGKLHQAAAASHHGHEAAHQAAGDWLVRLARRRGFRRAGHGLQHGRDVGWRAFLLEKGEDEADRALGLVGSDVRRARHPRNQFFHNTSRYRRDAASWAMSKRSLASYARNVGLFRGFVVFLARSRTGDFAHSSSRPGHWAGGRGARGQTRPQPATSLKMVLVFLVVLALVRARVLTLPTPLISAALLFLFITSSESRAPHPGGTAQSIATPDSALICFSTLRLISPLTGRCWSRSKASIAAFVTGP